MTGQEAVNVALAFQERIAFDGVVLTKLDGDARGGAALSVKAVTGRPIKLIAVGEKVDQLEYFHPDRMASRILGMGDVLTLIERAEQAVEEDEQKELEARMMKGQFTFDDFLKSYRMIQRMGSIGGLVKLIPGLGKQLEGIEQRRREAVRARRGDHPLDDAAGACAAEGDRRLPAPAIAHGSGTSVEEVNRLIEARKQMETDDERHEQRQDSPSSRRGGSGTAGAEAQGDEIQQAQEAIEDTEVVSWQYE